VLLLQFGVDLTDHCVMNAEHADPHGYKRLFRRQRASRDRSLLLRMGFAPLDRYLHSQVYSPLVEWSGSLNRGLLRAAQEIAPVGVEIRLADLTQIPLFSEDVEVLGDPVSVQEFKRQIRTADALLIATPEYNGSIPGVLKNALDWASRLPRQSALVGKSAALMGASPGPSGTAGSQADLRRVLARTHSRVLAEPQVLFANANLLFDNSANLIDDAARQELRVLVDALAVWVRQERTTAASA
jgi:chromate reductase